jgi:hypothetical protein
MYQEILSKNQLEEYLKESPDDINTPALFWFNEDVGFALPMAKIEGKSYKFSVPIIAKFVPFNGIAINKMTINRHVYYIKTNETVRYFKRKTGQKIDINENTEIDSTGNKITN